MVPIPAPLEDVAVHVVNTPGIGRVTAYFRCPVQHRAPGGVIEGETAEIGLVMTERIAIGCGGVSPRPAGIFPLGFGGQSKLLVFGELSRLMKVFRQGLAKAFGLGVADPVHGILVSQAPERSGFFVRKAAHGGNPLSLGNFKLSDPETLGEGDPDLKLIRASAGLLFGTSHDKVSGRAPSKPDAVYDA